MPSRILIWGAGAIGGSVGAWLKRAGHDICFVDVVPEHVVTIRGDGLRQRASIKLPILFRNAQPQLSRGGRLPDGAPRRISSRLSSSIASRRAAIARALAPRSTLSASAIPVPARY